jgi:2'-5' RNA ligase
MSPLPTQMANHWWQRPGRHPGRELYHWHMLFHDQPAVRELAATAQARLTGLPGLDMVPLRWLHVTTYILAFVDEITDSDVEAMVGEARRLLHSVEPISVTLGRVLYHPQAVTLAIEPLGALDPVLHAVQAATRSIGCDGHTDTNPWVPHVSVAYSNSSGPVGPVIAALGRRLPMLDVAIRSVSLVAQTQVGHTWQWRPIAEIPFAGQPPAQAGFTHATPL